MTLDELFATYIEGYLLGDLDKLRQVATENPARGALFYPALMTCCAALELFGALDLVDEPYPGDHRQGSRNFRRGWELAYPKCEAAGASFYTRVRHGVAHTFIPKGRLDVLTRADERAAHLSVEGGVLHVHVPQLCQDVEAAFRGWFREGSTERKRRAWAEKLRQIEADWTAPEHQGLPRIAFAKPQKTTRRPLEVNSPTPPARPPGRSRD